MATSSKFSGQVVYSRSSSQDVLAIWKSAPDEQSTRYFPVFARVSRAVQQTLREWTRNWFVAHPEVLERRGLGYTFLVYLVAGIYEGCPENEFTYDVQQNKAIQYAYRSALRGMRGELRKLDTSHLPWQMQERYLPYCSKQVVAFVEKKHRALFAMFHAETAIMDDLTRFALVGCHSPDPVAAVSVLRKSIALRLRRFSRCADFSRHSEELLQIATKALSVALNPASKESKKKPVIAA